MKVIVSLIKKIIISFCLIYGYNMFAGSLGFVIPVNVFTILFITFFDIPALLSLIMIMIIFF